MNFAMMPNIWWAIRTIFPSAAERHAYPLHVLHILIEPGGCSLGSEVVANYTKASAEDLEFAIDQGESQAQSYLLDQLSVASSSSGTSCSLNFILPNTPGYMIRSDFLQIRLHTFLQNHQIRSFREPLEYCEVADQSASLIDLVRLAIGAFSIPIDQAFEQDKLDQELCDRLSYQWLSNTPIQRRRVALIRGRPNIRIGGPVYSAAKSLGVSLVIVDEDGHWLQAESPRNKELREAFLTIDMSEDDGLPDRIATAINGYGEKINGIFTLSDNYLVYVAKAADLLHLSRSSSSAYEVAFDKALTRQLHAAPDEHATVRNETELQEQIEENSFKPQYPLIVKPRTRGWNSQFVRKVNDHTELLQAVRLICPKYNDGVVIEPYYEGPEIDVNIVMSDGQVIFREIVDEPPSLGDLGNKSSADFLENGMRAPSILPQQEQQIIFDTVSEYLNDMGFMNGVFHVEARVSKSSMELQEKNGSIDLVPMSTEPSQDLRVHLIEINARPPGLRAQVLTQLTYGVDYFAVQILSSIDDKERLRTVCQPFSVPGFPQGAQAWSQLIHLPVLKKGITLGVAGLERFLEHQSHLATYVVEYQSCFEAGETLPDPMEHADFYGHIIVSSSEGRAHVVEVADEIMRAYQADGGDSTMTSAFDGEEKFVSYDGAVDSFDLSLDTWRNDSVLSGMFAK